jgi:hypothetical protein
MKRADFDKSERIIRAGLAEAERVIKERALEMKKQTPGLPLAVLEIEARRGSSNVSMAALRQIEEQRKLNEADAATKRPRCQRRSSCTGRLQKYRSACGSSTG